jgi:hypothetical protein
MPHSYTDPDQTSNYFWKHLQFRDDRVSFVEADGPGFESFRIAVLFGLSGVTFVVTEKEVFSWLEGPRIKSIRGSALPAGRQG